MGTGNKRWGQFLVLIVLTCSFFYFILQVDIEEDLQVDLQVELEVDPKNGIQDKLSKFKDVQKSFPKSFMNPVTYVKQTNFFQDRKCSSLPSTSASKNMAEFLNAHYLERLCE